MAKEREDITYSDEGGSERWMGWEGAWWACGVLGSGYSGCNILRGGGFLGSGSLSGSDGALDDGLVLMGQC